MKRTLTFIAAALLVGATAQSSRADSSNPNPAAPPHPVECVPMKSQATTHATACAPQACRPVPACATARVNFGLNSADLDDTGRAALDRTAECLKANPDLPIIVEGATDERGSDDYNLDLGQRRALTVAIYLQSRGVSLQQLAALSMGKGDPLCQQSNEDCWSQNRRASLMPSTRRQVARASRQRM